MVPRPRSRAWDCDHAFVTYRHVTTASNADHLSTILSLFNKCSRRGQRIPCLAWRRYPIRGTERPPSLPRRYCSSVRGRGRGRRAKGPTPSPWEHPKRPLRCWDCTAHGGLTEGTSNEAPWSATCDGGLCDNAPEADRSHPKLPYHCGGTCTPADYSSQQRVRRISVSFLLRMLETCHPTNGHAP